MTDESFMPRVSHPKRVSWLTVVLALLAIGTFIAVWAPDAREFIPPQMMGTTYGVQSSAPAIPRGIQIEKGAMMDTISTSGSAPANLYYQPYPRYSEGVPVTDTREFLKVNYGATMQTRDVQALTRRVETIIRGYKGRVDNESSSPQVGFVQFAVPMSTYEEFRAELESLVPSRFLTVNVSSQNLLPQKQSIEEQQKQADDTLTTYQSSRQQLVSTHTTRARALQSQIDTDENLLSALSAQPQTNDTQIRIQTISSDLASARNQLSAENATYAAQLSNVDASIKSAKDWQTAVKTQDQALLDNVATVSGTVSIRWISLWNIALLYLPGFSIPAIFAVLAFLSYLWDRRRFGTA